MNPELLRMLLGAATPAPAAPAAPAPTVNPAPAADPRAALLAALLGAAPAPAAPAPAAPAPATTIVEGPLRRFRSGTLLGDLRVQRLPVVQWLAGKTRKDGDFMWTPTVWRGIAHVGPHGRAWVTDLVDTGVPYTPNAPAADDTDFDAALAQALEAAAPAAPAAPAPAEPEV
jgi:hypothetical protein